jgi:hypothetical protein
MKNDKDEYICLYIIKKVTDTNNTQVNETN